MAYGSNGVEQKAFIRTFGKARQEEASNLLRKNQPTLKVARQISKKPDMDASIVLDLNLKKI